MARPQPGVPDPIAAPSIMGLFGFMIATVMLGAWQAGWYGSAQTPLLIWPFALVAGGVLFVISAAAAWLVAGAMTLEHAFGRTIIPLGQWPVRANVPGKAVTDPISYPVGMPGVRVGQQQAAVHRRAHRGLAGGGL